MLEFPDDISKEKLREHLVDVNKEWKKEMHNKGIKKENEYALEQLKNYKAHIEDYLDTTTFKKERAVPKKGTASDGFTPEELKRELDLESFQTEFLKRIDTEDKNQVKKANEFIRKKKEHWFD